MAVKTSVKTWMAMALGAAAMTLKTISLEAAVARKPVATTPVTAVPTADKSAEKASCPVTDVCPLPPEKISG